MKQLLACALALLLASPLLAAEVPVLYSRSNLIIMRAALPPAPPPMPWQGNAVAPENPGVVFDIEVRDAATLYRQSGWYNLSSPDEKTGVLMAFAGPVVEPIVRSAQYAPLDILMIDKEGSIIQIVPNIMLSSLEQDINPPSPITAFLFLRGGACEHLSIHPGDIVLYKLFKRPPTVLTAPPAHKTPQDSPIP